MTDTYVYRYELLRERDALRAERDRLREQVRQMSLHALGCSGLVGTDGVECEFPDEGPCLVASLRGERDRLREALGFAIGIISNVDAPEAGWPYQTDEWRTAARKFLREAP